MTTIRVVKNANYTVINNTVLEDPRLSWQAKAIAVYLLSRIDTWRINSRNLSKVSTNRIHATQSALRELQQAGYLHRRRYRKENGLFAWEQVLYETPQTIQDPDPEDPGEDPDDEPEEENPQPSEPEDETGAGNNQPTMIGFSDHGTVIGFSDHGLSDHGKPDQLISTDPVSTEGVSTDQENTRRESGASADGADAPPSPTADFDLDAVPQEEPERTPKADLGSGTPNQRQSNKKTPAQKAPAQRPTPAPEYHRTWRDGIHELVKDSDYLRGAEKQFDRHGNLPPGSGTNPVQIWYELFPITDPTARWNAVYERKLAQNFPDINKFRAIATTFSERGYERTKNFECLRDWYNDPSKMNRTYASSTSGSNPTGATTAGTNGGPQNASTTQTADDDAEFNARYANPQIMPTVPIRDTPAAYA